MRTSTALPLGHTTRSNVREQRLSNGIMIYGTLQEIRSLIELVDEYPTLRKDGGFVDILVEEWMKLPLHSGWESKVSEKAKIYPVSLRDCQCMDTVFDKIHCRGRLTWTKASTPFNFPAFVVWKTHRDGTQKGRLVVDIRSLNKVLIPDVYALPSQSKIIAMLQGCPNLSVLNATLFF